MLFEGFKRLIGVSKRKEIAKSEIGVSEMGKEIKQPKSLEFSGRAEGRHELPSQDIEVKTVEEAPKQTVWQQEKEKFYEKHEALKFSDSAVSMTKWRHEVKGVENINQDAFIQRGDILLYAAFDGLGGVPGGEKASERAKVFFEKKFESLPFEMKEEEASKIMREAMSEAHQQICTIEIGGQKKLPGTTATVVKFFRNPESKKLYGVIGNVGDSRLYQITQGKLRKLTEDHDIDYRLRKKNTTVVFDENSGGIPDTPLDTLSGTENPVLSDGTDLLEKLHMKHGLNSYLGINKDLKKPDYVDVDLVYPSPGDFFIVGSDGLYKNASSPEMQHIVEKAPNVEFAAVDLAQHAYSRSLADEDGTNWRTEADDITIVCFQLPSDLSGDLASELVIRQAA